jgi:DNA-binding NtrC family response regulator
MASSKKKRILVVDDDAAVVDYLVEALRSGGYEPRGVVSGDEALGALERDDFDLVVTDVEMPRLRGTDLMAAIHARRPGQLVILITAFGSIDLAVDALRAGASDLVTKPFKIEVLCHSIERALRERTMRREIVRLREAAELRADAGGLVARSPQMQKVLETAGRAATTDATVLITGESGTGKGAVARYVHERSQRSAAPFVHVNCAALPLPLIEAELFGAKRGAYTDAREERHGLFMQARGGTLFLDEVGEMPLDAQPKLLRALESGRVRPVGGGAEVDVDVRVVAATNFPLENALRERRFRPDLYYRLNIVRIDVPPLRGRGADIEALTDVFLHRASAKLDRPKLGVSAEAMRWLLGYDWPGNVRELSNLLERAVVLSVHDTIVLDDLVLSHGGEERDFLSSAAAQGLPLADVEKAYMRKVLEAARGNKTLAAKILGIDRRTLYRKVGEAGVDEPTADDVT